MGATWVTWLGADGQGVSLQCCLKQFFLTKVKW